MTKPPMAYFGGKTRLADRIADLLPPHLHYVEPFGGSLAVLLAKPPSRHETVNDIDGDLVAFWRVLRDRPADLIRACALTPHSRIEHDLAYDLDTAPDDVERARRVWTQIVQGRAGVYQKAGWRIVGETKSGLVALQLPPEQFPPATPAIDRQPSLFDLMKEPTP